MSVVTATDVNGASWPDVALVVALFVFLYLLSRKP